MLDYVVVAENEQEVNEVTEIIGVVVHLQQISLIIWEYIHLTTMVQNRGKLNDSQ